MSLPLRKLRTSLRLRPYRRWILAVLCLLTLGVPGCTPEVVAIVTEVLVVVSGEGSGSGRVTATLPEGDIDCTITAGVTSGRCSVSFSDVGGSGSFALFATQDPGSVFSGWSSNCSGTEPICTLSFDSTDDVFLDATAHFDLVPPPTRTLTVAGAGTGAGSVVSSPEGINCTILAGVATGTCASAFDENANVTLTPTASAGSAFTVWAGDCAGAGNCSVTMTADRAATAQFDLVPPPTLTVVGAGGGAGSVVSSPAGINCAIAAGVATGSCAAAFDENADVTLTPTASAGSAFTIWAGDCAGAGDCAVTMTADKTATARFGISSPSVNALVQADDAPVLETLQATFTAVAGERQTFKVRYDVPPTEDDSGNFFSLDLHKGTLVALPDGTPIGEGDTVLITVTIDPVSLQVELEPSGLRFDPAEPAELRISYSRANPDLNGDGAVDSLDSDLEDDLLGLWMRPSVGAEWQLLETAVKDLTVKRFRADILHFSGYVVAW